MDTIHSRCACAQEKLCTVISIPASSRVVHSDVCFVKLSDRGVRKNASRVTIQTPNRRKGVLNMSYVTEIVLVYCGINICKGTKRNGDEHTVVVAARGRAIKWRCVFNDDSRHI